LPEYEYTESKLKLNLLLEPTPLISVIYDDNKKTKKGFRKLFRKIQPEELYYSNNKDVS
jgi:hypothetical protein